MLVSIVSLPRVAKKLTRAYRKFLRVKPRWRFFLGPLVLLVCGGSDPTPALSVLLCCVARVGPPAAAVTVVVAVAVYAYTVARRRHRDRAGVSLNVLERKTGEWRFCTGSLAHPKEDWGVGSLDVFAA